MSFLHGQYFMEGSSGVRALPLKFSGVIALVGTSEDADVTKYPLNKNVICQNDADLALLGAGWLKKAVELTWKMIKTRIIIVRVAAGADDAAKAVNILGSLADKEGVYALLCAKAETDYDPGLLVSELSEKIDIAKALGEIAGKAGAQAIVQCPDEYTVESTEYENAAAAKKYVLDIVDKNVYAVWPNKVKTDSAGTTFDAAVVTAALFVWTDDHFGGPWESPSNQVIQPIFGTVPTVDFNPGDDSCTANDLNENHVNTIIRDDGFRLWGNHTTTPGTSEQWRFVTVKRVSDMFKKTIRAGVKWAQDRGIKKNFVSDVEASVSGVIDDVKTAGGVLGGACWAEADDNSVTLIKQGKIKWKYKYGPVYPAENMGFEENLTDEYIEEIFE